MVNELIFRKLTIRYLLVLCLSLVLSACPIGHRDDRPWVFSDIISIENKTSYYPFVLSLEFSERWGNYTPYSIYLEINSQVRHSNINIDETFGRDRMRLDSLILFNLRDTTSITWDAVCLDWICSSYFGSLFNAQQVTPPWEMSSADSLKWYISRRSWIDFSGERGDYDIYYVRGLRVTDELLGIMEKNYSMLERFSEFFNL